MQRADPILVFDLDGTVLRLNSFPIWILFVGFGGIRSLSLKQQFRLTWRVLGLLASRKLGRINHETLQRHMQALWHFATAGDTDTSAQRLATLLLRLTRRNMASALKLVTDGAMDGILATAAAEEYANEIGQRIGFTHILATSGGRRPSEPANTGEHKRERLVAWLEQRGWTDRPLIFFNDHMADLPLMRDSSIVCWFGSQRSLEQAKRAAPHVRFVACRGLSETEMCITIAHLFQSVTVARLRSYAA